ncbi:hypothetical protein KIN20_021153 [Parelaphostrongylus tenuis]|uniref:Uncharacterized protein n=1 Tax=Parelaphostrongylus tenuis TaxID=148309 RepID=A0AAD5MNI9_PARTN|nr:hypothetical protein KIN20_021153 [Parelaphostrongylus tenuis]
MDINSATNFMLAVLQSGMKTDDYVYIIPWLAHTNEQYPWEEVTTDKQEVKAAFENTIIITAHGYDKKFFDEFQEKFAKENWDDQQSRQSMYSSNSLHYLFESFNYSVSTSECNRAGFALGVALADFEIAFFCLLRLLSWLVPFFFGTFFYRFSTPLCKSKRELATACDLYD